MLQGTWASSIYDIQDLSRKMVQQNIHHSISNTPTQYLCKLEREWQSVCKKVDAAKPTRSFL